MHHLNIHTRRLEYFLGSQTPPYAILSHTWGKDEVTMQDLTRSQVHLKEGYNKIVYTCEQALADGLDYAWIDACKSSQCYSLLFQSDEIHQLIVVD